MIEKIGLYDIAGSFCAGVVFLFLSYLIGIQTPLNRIVELFELMSNDVINIILFCIIAYFIGLLLHELTSVIETILLRCKIDFDYRRHHCRTFLISGNVIKNEEERDEYIALTRIIFGKSQNYTFNESDCEQIYQEYKYDVEQKGFSHQIERIDAIYKFCHTLSVTLAFIPLQYIVFPTHLSGDEKTTCVLVICFILAILLLDHKARRYSSYRIRMIVRYFFENNHQFF